MIKSWTDVWNLRTSLYKTLGTLLLEPIRKENKEIITPAFWANFPIEASANSQLESGLEQLINSTSKLEELHTEEAIESVMYEYTDLFIGLGVPKAAPIESFYRSDKKMIFGETTFEMKNMLNEHGLESIEKDRQPEDHLGMQLLFVAMLTEKLLTLEEEEHMDIIREQIPFIGMHLIAWIPDLCADAKEHGSVGFYGGLIELIWGVILWDKKLLEEFVTSHECVSL